MPEAVEKCVQSLLAKWGEDPKSRPTPRKGKDGKPQDKKSQAYAICQASQKKTEELVDELTTIALEGAGMTLMGLAVTNRPHLKGLPPVKIVKRQVGEEEKELFRIPLLLQGLWRHSKGNLVFNSKVFARLKSNLTDNVIGQDLCVDSRHNPDWGALGWLGPGFPGTGLAEEEDMLVAYAEPTSIGKEKVEQRLFRYASAELNTNFMHPKIGGKLEAAKLSTDEIDPLSLEEVAMSEETNVELQNDEVKLELEEQKKRAEELEQRLQKLEEQHEATVSQLDTAREQLVTVDHERFLAQVEAIMTRAEGYRQDGRAHPKVLLETARAALLMEPIKIGDEDGDVIQLEEADELTAEMVHRYHYAAIVYLLENLPGTVPTETGGTIEEPNPRVSTKLEAGEPTDDEVDAFLGIEKQED